MKLHKCINRKQAASAILCGICLLIVNGVSARTNLGLHKSVTADSYNGNMVPALVVDSIKSQGSRWENAYGSKPVDLKGNCWIYIDLGAKFLVDSVAIYWEHSGSKDYVVQTWPSDEPPSDNDTGWTILAHDTSLTYSAPPIDMCLSFLKLPPTETRFVRVHSYQRMWSWGVSIMEFEVYGAPITSITPQIPEKTAAADLKLSTLKNGININLNEVQDANLRADIYSIEGGLVRQLYGKNNILWDFKNDFGTQVTTGIYLLRVIGASKTIEDKIAVCR